MKSLFEKNGSTYTKAGDYYLPNLGAPNVNYKIGRYGRARRQYLKEHKKGEYTAFIKDAEKTAPDKATHQMEWVGHMNNARNSAEEVINQKLIYAIR